MRVSGLVLASMLAVGLLVPSPGTALARSPGHHVVLQATPISGHQAAGILLLADVDPRGEGFAPEVVAADETGAELRRIPLPDPGDGPMRAVPTELGSRALVQTGSGTIILIDAARGSATRLPVPEDTVLGLPMLRGGRRWALLGDPQGSAADLVDLASGKVTDLTALDPDIRFVLAARVSPADDAVLLYGGTGLWLIPTANPSQARRLGVDAYGGDFVEGGRAAVYARQTGPDAVEVVRERLDGGESRVLATGGRGTRVLVRPGQGENEVVLVRTGSLSLLPIAGGPERPVASFQGEVSFLQIAPSGHALLLGVEADDGSSGTETAAATAAAGTTAWRWVDLDRGRAFPLDGLAGQAVVSARDGAHWLLFAGSPGPARGQPGAGVAALDLETGSARHVLATEDEQTYYFLPPLSSTDDGAVALVMTTPPSAAALWLLDVAGGTSRLLTQGNGIAGALAPDGRWVAVGTLTRREDRTDARFVVRSTSGDAQLGGGSGIPLAWLRP